MAGMLTALDLCDGVRDLVRYSENYPFRNGFPSDATTDEARTILSLVNVSYATIVALSGCNQADVSASLLAAGNSISIATASPTALELLGVFTATRDLTKEEDTDAFRRLYGAGWRADVGLPSRYTTKHWPNLTYYPKPASNLAVTLHVKLSALNYPLVATTDTISDVPTGLRGAVQAYAAILFCIADGGEDKRAAQLVGLRQHFAALWPELAVLVSDRGPESAAISTTDADRVGG